MKDKFYEKTLATERKYTGKSISKEKNMKLTRRQFFVGFGAVAGMAGTSVIVNGCWSIGRETGTVVYMNGKIYTADVQLPDAEALVVSDGRIVYVGTSAGARTFAGREAKVVDLKGRRVLPGLVDTHVHPLFYSGKCGHGAQTISRFGTHEETLAEIKKFAAADKGGPDDPLFFWGFGEKCRPIASELDKLGIDRPVFLVAFDGHSGWMNTKAMKRGGITKNTPDSVPGASYYERDAEGRPTGHLIEFDQTFNALGKVGIFTEEDVRRGFCDFVQLFNSKGFTTCFDAGVLALDEETAFRAASRCREPMRLYASVVGGRNSDPKELADKLRRCRETYASENLHITTLKMFKDGTFEQGTALTYRKYKTRVGDGTGADMISSEKMLCLARDCAADGFNVHVHAFGAKAINETLEMYRKLGKIEGTKTVVHVQNVDATGKRLFAENRDVFMSTTPTWFGSHPDYDRPILDALGSDEAFRSCYPIGTVRRGGSRVVFGSDLPASAGPVPTYDAMANIFMAVNRGEHPNILKSPEEAFTVREAIDAYTIDAARMVRGESEFGSITVGKSADFIVLDRDILSIDKREIDKAKVVETYFRGSRVYHA